jgi:hypothetical protein
MRKIAPYENASEATNAKESLYEQKLQALSTNIQPLSGISLSSEPYSKFQALFNL